MFTFEELENLGTVVQCREKGTRKVHSFTIDGRQEVVNTEGAHLKCVSTNKYALGTNDFIEAMALLAWEENDNEYGPNYNPLEFRILIDAEEYISPWQEVKC